LRSDAGRIVCSILQSANCRDFNPVKLEDDVMMIGCMIATQVKARVAKFLYEQ